MLLNILIGTACIAVILRVLFDEHYRQENIKRMNKFTNLLDKLLPKAFPSLFANEIPDDQVTTGKVAEPGVEGFVPMGANSLPPELEEFLMNNGLAELELRGNLKNITLSVLEGHSFQIPFEDAEKKAIEIILKMHSQATNPLPEELELLIPKSTTDVNPVPEIPTV